MDNKSIYGLFYSETDRERPGFQKWVNDRGGDELLRTDFAGALKDYLRETGATPATEAAIRARFDIRDINAFAPLSSYQRKSLKREGFSENARAEMADFTHDRRTQVEHPLRGMDAYSRSRLRDLGYFEALEYMIDINEVFFDHVADIYGSYDGRVKDVLSDDFESEADLFDRRQAFRDLAEMDTAEWLNKGGAFNSGILSYDEISVGLERRKTGRRIIRLLNGGPATGITLEQAKEVYRNDERRRLGGYASSGQFVIEMGKRAGESREKDNGRREIVYMIGDGGQPRAVSYSIKGGAAGMTENYARLDAIRKDLGKNEDLEDDGSPEYFDRIMLVGIRTSKTRKIAAKRDADGNITAIAKGQTRGVSDAELAEYFMKRKAWYEGLAKSCAAKGDLLRMTQCSRAANFAKETLCGLGSYYWSGLSSVEKAAEEAAIRSVKNYGLDEEEKTNRQDDTTSAATAAYDSRELDRRILESRDDEDDGYTMSDEEQAAGEMAEEESADELVDEDEGVAKETKMRARARYLRLVWGEAGATGTWSKHFPKDEDSSPQVNSKMKPTRFY
jgi:hypothetical protein